MVRLREIPRTAAFAWSPGSAPPLIATGTRAGAVDDNFSDDTQLELWDLKLDDVNASSELQPVGSITTDSRFYDIAWGPPTADRSRGIIAGALENGSLDLWDAEKLRTTPADSFMSRTTKHTGAIKTLQFNHTRHELLASAGAKGELYIYDLNNIANPFRLGASAARADDYECMDWNKGAKVPHILATGSNGGFVNVWDVRGKKENLTLNNFGRKPVSAVAWDPEVATKLMTAIPNDQDPLILMWDLRNANAPERVLRGHELGVLSLSWCLQDSSLLLSSGKDNRNIAWNPHTGESYGDFPVVTNWTFQTRWNPHNPGLLATASFDGKIAVQTIQNTNPKNDEKTAAQQALDGEDFFLQAQTQAPSVSFSLPKAPKWMERPAGVSFGFGGKLVRLSTDAASRKSTVSIETFAVDSEVSESSQKFEDSLKGGDLAGICETKISAATNDEEKADWQVIETLNAGKSRKKLREYLGFADEADDLTAMTAGLNINGDAEKPKDKDDSSFFDNSATDGDDGDNFLADLAATKGAKTNQPFHIFNGEETDADKGITQALMLGKFEAALDICLKDGRMSDAFMIAICGGQKCMDKVQTAYLKQKAKGPNYLRLLASIVGKNLWDVVHNADLSNWKEVMATLCTFADETEFSDLCEALGDRLEEKLAETTDKGTLRRDASFCFLAGSKLEKVVAIWAQELQEKEHAEMESADGKSSFSVHAKSLQDFIEKVTVFRQVVNFQDAERQATDSWKLAPLYAKYAEYADILASHGKLQTAEKYLDLLPPKYEGAEVAQQRVKLATRKAPVAPQLQRQPAAAARVAAPMAPYGGLSTPAPAVTPSPYAPSGGIMSTPAPAAPSAYAPQAAANPYAPPAQSYAPAGYQPQQQQYGQPTPYGAGFGAPPAAAPLAPPPRGITPSAVPPPPKAGATQQWNDLPEGFSKPVAPARRNTPGMTPMASPFPNANIMSPPPPPGSAYGQKPAAPLPPPPKAGQVPSRVMSPLAGPQHIERPASAAANAYAPPQASVQSPPGSVLSPPQAPPAVRGPSPYNPPPAALASGPPTNRYAPAPGAQPSAPVGGPGLPPPRNIAPPPNPYSQTASPYAPQSGGNFFGQAQTPMQPPAPQAAAPPPPQGPPRGPPQGPPRAAPPPRATPPQAAPAQAAPPQPPTSRPGTAQSQRTGTPVAAKYPPGDRSHIPAGSQSIFDILSSDMARVKSRAPASFSAQVNDTEKRLNILFDHLNNETLLRPDTIQQMIEIGQALQARDFDRAGGIITDMMRTKLESEGANWMVGVKRLIAMSKATPV